MMDQDASIEALGSKGPGFGFENPDDWRAYAAQLGAASLAESEKRLREEPEDEATRKLAEEE